MKQKFSTILSAALAFALISAPVSGGISARDFSASAATQTVTQSATTVRSATTPRATEAEALVLPDSYEQYLPLVSPSDVSVTEAFTAVADGKSIYLYNRERGEYTLFTHSADVTELQFSGRTLYFLDKDMGLYTLGADNPAAATPTSLHCNSFTIDSDVIYYMTISGGTSKITPAHLSDFSVTDDSPVNDNLPSSPKPAMATYNGNLYYSIDAYGSSYIRNLQHIELEYRLPQSNILSVAVLNGVLYYTDSTNRFYAYDFATVDLTAEPLFEPISGCSAITAADDGFIYVVQGSSIRQYSPETQAFTDFEIAAASSSENRLSGATAMRLFKDRLFVADKANRRLSVTDLATGEHATYPAELAADYLATDGKTAIVADAQKAVLIDLAAKEIVRSFEGFTGHLLGAECVYGTYYFLTDANYFYRAVQNESGVWTLSGAPKTISTPKLLSSDIYGDLYVACADNKVYRFTESAFTDSSANGTETATVPNSATQIEIDFNRTVYALSENGLRACTASPVDYPLAKSFVFSQDSSTAVSSFTFDATDGSLYVLYNGNFVAKMHDLPVPALKNIPVNGADEAIFQGGNARFSLVEIQEKTLLIEFDMPLLNGASAFPYLNHGRIAQVRTALKLGEVDRFNLVAVFDENSKTYSTALAEKTSCSEISEANYLKPAEAFQESDKGYLTNAVDLYKFPYLTELLTLAELPKNAEVKVLGQIDDLDYRYYLVEYSLGEITLTGYLPQAYVTNFDGRPPQAEEAVFGDTLTDYDSLWRLAFILLGCVSIGILIDFLILRKKR